MITYEIIRSRIDEYQQQFNRTGYFVNKKGNVTLHGSRFSKAKSLDEMKGMHAISHDLLNKETGSFVYNNGEYKVFLITV